MQNFIKTMFNSIREWTKSEIFKSESKLKKQINENKADWAQNDENADDYIKNRTHWEDKHGVHKLDVKYLPDNLATQDELSDLQETLSTNTEQLQNSTNNVYSLAKKNITRSMTFQNGSSDLPRGDYWTNIAYGNGVFVISSQYFGYYSEDGIHWNKTYNMGGQAYYGALIFADNKFVYLREQKYGSYSTDGINWNPIIMQGTVYYNTTWRHIAYGNGIYVASGSDRIAYSTDGINWTIPSSTNVTTDGNPLVFGDGKFIKLANTNYYYSTDGINWTQANIPGNTQTLDKIVYGNNMWLIFTTGNQGLYYYSEDGINWNVGEYPNSTSWSPNLLTHYKDKFIYILNNSPTTGYYSNNGVDWNLINLPGNFRKAATDGTKLLAIYTNRGNDGSSRDIGYSNDGINWTTTYTGISQNGENILDEVKQVLTQDIELPTKLSSFENDTNYATETFVTNKIAEAELGGEEVDLSGYATKDEIKDFIKEVPAEYVTETELEAKGYAKKSELPTTPADIGAQPAGNYALKSEIPNVPVQSVNNKTGAVQLTASDVKARSDSWIPTAEQVGADAKGTANTAVSTHNTATDAHNDMRLELKDINDRLNAFFDSDDKTLDELSEIVAYITSNKALIDSITTSKISVEDIINNLTTNVANKPLSAAQGVALKALIDAIKVPTKVSELTNDSKFLTSVPSEYITETELNSKNYLTSIPSEYVTETELNNKKYLTSFTETDPTVPSWAKAATKPSYTASEVGAATQAEGVVFIEGSGTTDSTAKTSTWVGTSNRITGYYDGLAIRYKIGIEGQSTVTLNINNLGAKTVYRFDTTKLTTQFPVGSIITLIYHEDLNDGCWITNDYDANTNTQQRVYVSTNNVEYPITARYNTTTGSSYYAEYGRYSTGVTLNPSTNTITATNFKGTATKATSDGDGNNIASTYAKKANAETWTFTLKDGTTVTKKVVLG